MDKPHLLHIAILESLTLFRRIRNKRKPNNQVSAFIPPVEVSY
jgi:hypothetical protein